MLVTTLEHQKDTLSSKVVISALIQEEANIKSESASVLEIESSFNTTYIDQRTNHSKKGRCNYCEKPGHYESDCWFKINKREKGNLT
ncbi:hypothetical protein AYI69_g2912 [Smittium culicis]|uniref:CCHC-type domain-containing protein n=1 Tax=Smittium culicis TaxID=133412 RepID=A0A1R1YLG7_9FUNG|nr:hypothetical protein AYI69_g2912 [Smittium culicis]